MLQRFSAGEGVEHSEVGVAEPNRETELAFIYSGMGPQWWAMGRELLNTEPLFLSAIEECDAVFRKQAGWSILEELLADESESRMAETEVAQPANFVIQVGLTELWKSWGIEPSLVIGHSVGEVASAYVSGALSLEDAITVSIHRSRLQQSLAGNGTMLAAGMSESAAIELIAPYEGVSIAAINSPESVTLSGDADQLREIAQVIEGLGIFNRRLDVEVAYHSSQMDPIKDELLASLELITPRAARIPFYSTVMGEKIRGEELTADYWWDNIRKPVRFHQGVTALLKGGTRDFLEVGPHPVLGHSVKEISMAVGTDVNVTASLNRKSLERTSLLGSLGKLYVQGSTVDWRNVIGSKGSLVSLPSYPWQRQKCWSESIESAQYRFGRSGSPFLNRRSTNPQLSWIVELNDQYFPFLEDHKINDRIVFPGAAYIESGLALYKECLDRENCILSDLVFENMLFIERDDVQELCISFDNRENRFYFFSRNNENPDAWLLNAHGSLVDGAIDREPNRVDIEQLKGNFINERISNDVYTNLGDRGLNYGKRFRCIDKLFERDGEVLAHATSMSGSVEPNQYLLPPELLDSAFQSILYIVDDLRPFVPVSIESVRFFKPVTTNCWIHGEAIEYLENSFKSNIRLIDENGIVCADISGLKMKAINYTFDTESSSEDDLLYADEWEVYDVEKYRPHENQNNVVFFTNESTFYQAIANNLSTVVSKLISVRKGESFSKINDNQFQLNEKHLDDFTALMSELDSSQPLTIIYAWAVNFENVETSLDRVANEYMNVVRLLSALDAAFPNRCTLTVVTNGSQCVDSSESLSGMNAASLWGFTPLVENEYERIACRLFDLDSHENLNQPDRLIDVLLSDGPNEIALRQSQFFTKKLLRISEKTTEELQRIGTDQPVALCQARKGQLNSLSYVETTRTEPGPSEVELKVSSSCLNFKDILKVFAKLPDNVTDNTFFGTEIGMEIAGTVVRVGNLVKDYQIGDKVVSPISGSMRSYATVPETYLVKVPMGIDPSDFFIHIGYLTAFYGLVEIGRLKAGEKVLIHSASGGLGLAAIQISKWIGAEIFATAGSEQKRDYLKSIGISHVMNSRTIDYHDEILELTKGKGVDVVLNSLSGDYLRQSLSVLAPYGRFIEVGKKDISANAGLPLGRFNHNITFSAIDIDRMHAERPDLVVYFTDKVRQGFSEGHFGPIPTAVFAANDIRDAVLLMSKSEHIGKIVINFDNEIVDGVPLTEKSDDRTYNGTYLVSGGNGGFCLEVARWLASNGADRLVLASRGGPKTKEAIAIINEIADKGVIVESEKLDITNIEQVNRLIERLQTKGPPLKGVIHGAMVLKDSFIKDLTEEDLLLVLAPKIQGLLNLYRATRQMELKFFVSFSSISAALGNRGQSNYIAANVFLDTFSQIASNNGFPIKSISWGALADTGILARNKDVSKLLKLEGVNGISNKSAIAAFKRAIGSNSPRINIFDIDWETWIEANPIGAKNSRFSNLLSNFSSNKKDNGVTPLIETLKCLEPIERKEFVQKMAINSLCKLLKLPHDHIDDQKSLDNLGIDSLLLLELALVINTEFGVKISATELSRVKKISELTEMILGGFEQQIDIIKN